MNASKIIWDAHAIVEEIATKFPKHASMLRSLRIEVSNRMRRSMGKCSFRGGIPFLIGISGPVFAILENEIQFRDTVLHEIAHAIAGIQAGHKIEWKLVARMVGANPERTCDSLPVSVLLKVPLVPMPCCKCGKPLDLTRSRARRYQYGIDQGSMGPGTGYGFHHRICP
jgi:hypothetical protein